MKITSSTRISFGKYKGRKLRDIPPTYLNWMINHMWDGEFHEWALAAQKELKDREKDERFSSLEEEADEILRRAGYDPKSL
jgi:uncharacterized protein (DUF3820 family)